MQYCIIIIIRNDKDKLIAEVKKWDPEFTIQSIGIEV